jgi:hypothetical protein
MPTPKKRLKVSTRQFIGKVLDVDVEDGEPYNGRVKSEVRGYLRSEKAAAAADSGSDADPSSFEPSDGLDEFAAAAEDVDLDSLDLG